MGESATLVSQSFFFHVMVPVRKYPIIGQIYGSGALEKVVSVESKEGETEAELNSRLKSAATKLCQTIKGCYNVSIQERNIPEEESIQKANAATQVTTTRAETSAVGYACTVYQKTSIGQRVLGKLFGVEPGRETWAIEKPSALVNKDPMEIVRENYPGCDHLEEIK